MNKKPAVKKYNAFGTPVNKSNPFSSMAHLKVDDITLFNSLSSNDDYAAMKKKEEEERKKQLEQKNKISEMKDEFSKYMQTPADGEEECKRIDCKNVIRKIMDFMSKIIVEREEISDELEQVLQETNDVNGEVAIAEDKLKSITMENEHLNNTLETLLEELETYEKKDHELQQERDEFSNKMMVIETEKQATLQQVHQAHRALADAIWRGKDNTAVSHSNMPKIKFKKRTSPVRVSTAQSQAMSRAGTAATDASRGMASAGNMGELSLSNEFDGLMNAPYSSLASGGVIDIAERPPPSLVSSIPLYLRAQLLPSLDPNARNLQDMSTMSKLSSTTNVKSKAWQQRMFDPRGETNSPGMYPLKTAGQARGVSTPIILPATNSSVKRRVQKLQKLKKDYFAHLNMHKKAYPGYTPTGTMYHAPEPTTGPSLHNHAFGGMKGTKSRATSKVTDGLSAFSASKDSTKTSTSEPTWLQQDPLFYNDSYVKKFARDSSVGKLRVKDQQEEFNKVLTYRQQTKSKVDIVEDDEFSDSLREV